MFYWYMYSTQAEKNIHHEVKSMFIFLNSCVKAWKFTSDISERHRKRKFENFKQDFWIFVFFKLKFTAILAGSFQDRGYSCSIRSFFVSLSLFWPSSLNFIFQHPISSILFYFDLIFDILALQFFSILYYLVLFFSY